MRRDVLALGKASLFGNGDRLQFQNVPFGASDDLKEGAESG